MVTFILNGSLQIQNVMYTRLIFPLVDLNSQRGTIYFRSLVARNGRREAIALERRTDTGLTRLDSPDL